VSTWNATTEARVDSVEDYFERANGTTKFRRVLLTMKSSRLASVRPAALARLSEQQLASKQPSTLTRQRCFSRHSRVTVCLRTANVVRAGALKGII